MNFTDEQIEEAARILCEVRGLSPNDVVGVRTQPAGSGMYHVTVAWRNAAEEIREHIDIGSALRQAVERKPNAN